jgi:LacI family transcriptional regulator
VPSVSITDVAKRAGVSVGTVSNVLNKPDIVKPTTRAKVEAAIAKLGFVRNESARHLRGGQSRLLAYLMHDSGNPSFTELARGVETVARANGLGLLLCNSSNDPVREDEYLSLLLEQRIRGVLITGVDYANPRLEQLPKHGVPVVFVDRGSELDGAWCSVGIDDVEGGFLAVSHLLELGHKKIALAGGPLTIPQVVDRHRGAVNALESFGFGADELHILETPALDLHQGRQLASRLLGLPKRRRPTAVFCANDVLALGLLQELTQQGVSVPAELAIVGYDDVEFAAAATIPLSSVRQPRVLLGETAAKLLIEETTSGTKHKHQHIRFAPELIVRQSSLNPRSARQVG